MSQAPATESARVDLRALSLEETTESLIDEVLANHPPGLTVAVQLHGYLPPEALDRLREAHDRVLTVERLRDDVAPCRIAEREEQPVRPSRAFGRIYNHLVVDYAFRRRCQADRDSQSRANRREPDD